jgi:hypothetical protein
MDKDMKTITQQILFNSIFGAMAFGLVACGGNEPVNNGVLPPPPPPSIPNYAPNNTQSGCIGVVANETFAWFGGEYDVVRAQYMPSYQCMYGNIRLVSAVQIGYNTTIPAGSYTWQSFYDQVTNAMSSCCVVGGSNGGSIWASVDYDSFGTSFGGGIGSGYFDGYTLGNSQVTFDRPGVVSDFRNLFYLIAQLNSQYYYSMYQTHQPQGYVYYGSGAMSRNQMFGGLSYNSGGGFSLSFGGSFGR